MRKYEVSVPVAKMFSPKEVLAGIIGTLESKIFMGRSIKVFVVK